MTHEANQLVEALHDQIYNDGYSDGLNDAWECAGKIGALGSVERKEIFGSDKISKITCDYNPKESIELIKLYEKTHRNIKDDIIRVGDEVIFTVNNPKKGICISVDKGITTAFPYYVLLADGETAWISKNDITKTGKHYQAITDVLRSE